MDGRTTPHPGSSEKDGGQPNPLFSSRPDKYVRCGEELVFPYIHRSLVAVADGCKECTESSKRLKPMCAKVDIGKVYEPREPNECLQLDFCGPIKYLNQSNKYVFFLAVDRFLRVIKF